MARKSPTRPIIVAIAGGSATGKSTLARLLAQELADLTPVILNQDRYFRDFAELSEEERERQRTANHPDAVNWPAYHLAFTALRDGNVAVEPAEGTRARQREEPHPIGPAGVLLVEGLFALWDEPTRLASDLRLYLEIDDDERVLRRIHRDIAERNATVEGVITWFRRDVQPNYPIYTSSTKRYADLVVLTNKPSDNVAHILAGAIRALR
ncbi:MAG TPA: zeta toxin family protein [Chloroflexota bacterium]|nr:zeta toxin family protein [Chloroflexota bacterium]